MKILFSCLLLLPFIGKAQDSVFVITPSMFDSADEQKGGGEVKQKPDQ